MGMSSWWWKGARHPVQWEFLNHPFLPETGMKTAEDCFAENITFLRVPQADPMAWNTQ